MNANKIIIAGDNIFRYCPVCKQYVDLIKWYKLKSGSLASSCKHCKQQQRYKDKEYTSQYNAKYQNINKNHLSEYYKQYQHNNKEHITLRCRRYHQNNKEYFIQYHRKYEQNQYENNIEFRITKSLRARLNIAIRNQNTEKTNCTFTLVGCNIGELKQYLTSKFTKDMTWNNYGAWHIDHIIPCASFDLSDPKEQQRCFHYTNLQPLWAKDNSKKGSKLPYVNDYAANSLVV